MYGVPRDLPVQRFVGDYISQIGIGVDGVHFRFGEAGTISVEGRWELFDGSGAIVDEFQTTEARDCYRVQVILNQNVIDCGIEPPISFSLSFASGHRLVIYDDSAQFESFHFSPDGIVV